MNLKFLINRLKYLKAEKNGNSSENFAANTLTASGLATLSNKALLESYLKLMSSAVERAVISTDVDGSLWHMSNVVETAGVITLKATGTATRIRQEGSNGTIYIEYYTGTAGDTISNTSWLIYHQISTTTPLILPGDLTGTLEWQSATLPPTIKSGCREIKGIAWKQIADQNLALTDAFKSNSQVLADYAYSWGFVLMHKDTGVMSWSQAFDVSTPIATNVTATGASFAGGSVTVTYGGALPAVGTIAIVVVTIGGVDFVIQGKVTVSGAGSFQVKTALTGTVTAVRFWNYYRIVTLHNAIGAVTLDIDIEKFTPSLPFSTVLNLYGADLYGIPTSTDANIVYRILGIFYIHTGPLVEYIYSYKTGSIKNDNQVVLTIANTAATFGGTSTKHIRFTGFLYAHGSDTTYTDSATFGGQITVNKSCKPNLLLTIIDSTTANSVGIYVNDPTPTTTPATTKNPLMISLSANIIQTQYQNPNCKAGDIITVSTNGAADTMTANMVFNLSE